MEVTNKNFKKSLPAIKQAISECDFLAIDGEFTGINISGNKIHGLDTPPERYSKVRQCVGEYLLVQFGLACFHYDTSKKKYITKAFNFYVFPRQFSRQAPDTRFLSQSSSLSFLAENDFDFNKLIREGISYLTPVQEGKLRESLRVRHELWQSSSPAFSSPRPMPPSENNGSTPRSTAVVPDEHKAFIEGICDKIQEFLDSNDDTLKLLPCNAFLRKLIFQTAGARFQTSIHLDSQTDEKKNRFIQVSKVKSESDYKAKEDEKKNAEIQELDDAVGFTKVINMISQSGKVMVGHNMFTDLLFILEKFVSNPLPEEYEEFKALVKGVFPRVMDTKTISSTQPIKEIMANTGLSYLQKSIEQEPFTKPDVEIVEGFGEYCTSSEQFHEAGYDAYITGMVFIAMSNYLGTLQNPEQEHVAITSPLIQPFLNKLHMMRVYDIPYMNLSGPDLQAAREHVFHIKFPTSWKNQDLYSLFNAFGNIQVAWIDDSSAFVSLWQRDNAPYVMNKLGTSEIYRLLPYADFQEQKAISSAKTVPVSNIRKRIADVDVEADVAKKRKKSLEKMDRLSFPTIEEENEDTEDTGTPKIKKPFDEPSTW